MKLTTALAAVLIVSVCLLCCVDAWGFSRRRAGGGRSRGGGSSYPRRNSTRNCSCTIVAVRRVDEEHPYFRAYKFNKSSSNPLADLKTGLAKFFNKSSNITWLVKNDRLLITKDKEVSWLGSRDQLEVWFADSGAPTRSRTVYAFAKEARMRLRWRGGRDGAGDRRPSKAGRGKDHKRRGDRRRRPERDDEGMEEFLDLEAGF